MYGIIYVTEVNHEHENKSLMNLDLNTTKIFLPNPPLLTTPDRVHSTPEAQVYNIINIKSKSISWIFILELITYYIA